MGLKFAALLWAYILAYIAGAVLFTWLAALACYYLCKKQSPSPSIRRCFLNTIICYILVFIVRNTTSLIISDILMVLPIFFVVAMISNKMLSISFSRALVVSAIILVSHILWSFLSTFCIIGFTE